MGHSSFRAVVLAVAAFVVQAASADLLYFMIGNDPATYGFATVSVIADGSDTPSDPLGLLSGGDKSPIGSALDSSSTEPVLAELPDGYTDADTVLFELWQYEAPENPTASRSILVSDLRSYIGTEMSPTGYTVVNVPEPAGGVLVLWGLAALGLRRRRSFF